MWVVDSKIKPRIKLRKNKIISNNGLIKNINKNYELYIMVLPLIIYFLIFHYGPMYGVQIAFKDYIPFKGILDSPWVGMEQFTRFFSSYNFWQLLQNTILLSVIRLVAGFPVPIILAIMMNSLMNKKYKKFVQTITYAPHFISVVVMVGMLTIFLSPRTGIFNQFLQFIGMEPINFMGSSKWFRTIFVASGIWQHMGWSSIIYLAALTGVDPLLHEAAIIDGASKLQRILYIDLPGLKPTIIILFILNMGRMMNVAFQKVLLMQNPLNIETAEVISTYVYKMGLVNMQYSYATAIGLFNNLINAILLITFNYLSKKYARSSLF